MIRRQQRSTLFPYTTLFRSGKMRARINWKENNFETDDFSKNPWPYRAVIAPFFAKSKALIEYALTTRSEEHTSELQSRPHLVCRLLLEKKKKTTNTNITEKD